MIRFKIDFPPFEGLNFVCIYLLKNDNINVLIDAGLYFIDWRRLFFSALKNLNFSIKDIDYCIITHEHIDHIGLIQTLKRKNPNIQILMHKFAHDIIKWETDAKNYDQVKIAANDLANQMIKYGISKEQGKRIVQFFTTWNKLIKYHKPDRILVDNDEIAFNENKLKIVWTPGHAIGHICVFEENNRYLFSGDHILSRITPHIGNFVISPMLQKEYDFSNILDFYLKSLDRIDNLNSKMIFPAHQEVIYNPHERILDIKKHHERRLSEISDIIKDNPMTPLKISYIHFGEDLSEINTFLAISEVLSHLIYLERQDKVERIEKKGKILFFS
ncbi:MAG: MBL fold metallo-hydrolase [Promethearchaeota archaeon]